MTSLLALPAWWERFWFRPGSAVNLAAARMVFAGQSLWILLSRDYAATSGLPPEYWSGVTLRGQWRFLAFPGHPGIEYLLQGIAVTVLVAALVGLYPRLACLAGALLLYHLAPLETIYWTHTAYTRGLTFSVLGLFVLGLAPSGDALALWPRRPGAHEAWEYHWPLVLLFTIVSFSYLFAAYAKIVAVGPDWLSGLTAREWLYLLSKDDQVAVFSSLGLWLAARPALCTLIGVGTIIFEAGFIAAVFSKRARRVIIPLAFAFHTVVLFSMNIVWLTAPMLLIFIDWEAVGRKLRGCKTGRAIPA